MEEYNYKKIILNDFIKYLQEKKVGCYLFKTDEELKENIDYFIDKYYINEKDFEKYKKFLYLTFLNKYTNCSDFSNSDKEKLWDL